MKHKSFVPNSYLPIADNGCGDFTETAYHDILEYLLDVGLKAL